MIRCIKGEGEGGRWSWSAHRGFCSNKSLAGRLSHNKKLKANSKWKDQKVNDHCRKQVMSKKFPLRREPGRSWSPNSKKLYLDFYLLSKTNTKDKAGQSAGWQASCCEESSIRGLLVGGGGGGGQPNEKLEAKHNCLIQLTKPPLESRRPCISFIVQVLHFDLTLCHTCTLFSTTVYNLNHIYVF